jgi:hypothetical protein
MSFNCSFRNKNSLFSIKLRTRAAVLLLPVGVMAALARCPWGGGGADSLRHLGAQWGLLRLMGSWAVCGWRERDSERVD